MTDILVRKDDLFLNGNVLRKEQTKWLVQLKDGKEWIKKQDIFRFLGGSVRPVASTKQEKKYNRRKVLENNQLLYDVFSYGFDIGSSRLLALDDFTHNLKPGKIPNTTKAWLCAGGKAENVWVPNPSSNVANAITAVGGHGFTGTLQELLKQESLPQFNVLYLDFCGFFSKHSDDIETLFKKRLFAKKALLHVTFCKREGGGIVEDIVFPQLDAWCDKYACGRVTMSLPKHSETMWKGSFLIWRV